EQVIYGTCTNLPIGGDGGKALSVSQSMNKLFMGGGGGSGHQNDNNNVGYHGKNGGGIIFISASSIEGNSYIIRANGGNNTQMPNTDGAGGGGGAGTIILNINSISGTLNLEAMGGNGGNINSPLYCLGPGGGGSGGVVWLKGTLIPSNLDLKIDGGNSGKQVHISSPCTGSKFGSTDGETGLLLYSYIVQEGVECIQDTLDSSTQIFIPNVITPNGDGQNDYFVIKNIPPNTEIVIFNRWGNKVFESENYLNNWDGTNLRGEKVSDGVYFFVLRNKGIENQITGTITVMR
nr:gliding motility-associated C-terminal domain-containing protein [Bacteroidota bacterium]